MHTLTHQQTYKIKRLLSVCEGQAERKVSHDEILNQVEASLRVFNETQEPQYFYHIPNQRHSIDFGVCVIGCASESGLFIRIEALRITTDCPIVFWGERLQCEGREPQNLIDACKEKFTKYSQYNLEFK